MRKVFAVRSRVCRREGCRRRGACTAFSLLLGQAGIRLTCGSPPVLDAGEEFATDVLGDVVAEGAVERTEAGVTGSWVVARFVGDPGRLEEGYWKVVVCDGNRGGTNGGSGSEG